MALTFVHRKRRSLLLFSNIKAASVFCRVVGARDRDWRIVASGPHKEARRTRRSAGFIALRAFRGFWP